MEELLSIPYSKAQRTSVEDFVALASDEDRLEWLLERRPFHHPVPDEHRSADRRIPGCPSGLWLSYAAANGRLYFSSYSESAMVQAISSFLCDLYSDRSAEELLSVHPVLANNLRLERLLSITRKRAIAVVTEYIFLKTQVELPKMCANSDGSL